MAERLLTYAFQFGSYLLEAGVLVYIFRRGYLRRLWALASYLGLLLGVEALREAALLRFGFSSSKFGYTYWVSDVVLTLAAFALVCVFFRRACLDQPKMWKHLRLMLAAVFVLVFAVTAGMLAHNYDHLFTRFIIGFGQNLYFTSLVLVTMLYLLLVQLKSRDDELILLVTGLGIQFAGPAAVLALFHLTSGQGFARVLAGMIIPFCNVAKLGVWFYAVARVPKVAPQPAPELLDSRLRGNDKQAALMLPSRS